MRAIRHDTIDSTMLEARRLLSGGGDLALPFTVIAARQTGGVGRLGRPWSSPRGGWWFTVAVAIPGNRRTLRDDTALAIASWVCTACEAVISTGPRAGTPRLSIKWPNDIMAGDLKLAGVLIEVVQTADKSGAVALVGVGINAELALDELDQDVRDRATTLRSLMTSDIEPAITSYSLTLLPDKICDALEWPLPRGAVAELVRGRLWGAGRTVPITLPNGTRVDGRIDGITDDGSLLATIDGVQQTLRSVDQIG